MWCIEQAETSLKSGKLSDKRAADFKKCLKYLKNPQTPLVKMRQLMRTNFGDYRAKMAAEEKTTKGELDKGKIGEGIVNRDKVTFIKKSATLSGSKEPTARAAAEKTGFKFSFNIDK